MRPLLGIRKLAIIKCSTAFEKGVVIFYMHSHIFEYVCNEAQVNKWHCCRGERDSVWRSHRTVHISALVCV